MADFGSLAPKKNIQQLLRDLQTSYTPAPQDSVPSFGSLSAHEPTRIERMRQSTIDMTGSPKIAEAIEYGTPFGWAGQALDDAEAGADAASRGDYLSAAGNLGMAALAVVPDVGPVVKQGVKAGKKGAQKLVVSLLKDDGSQLVGKAGQTHADLAMEHNYFPSDQYQGFTTAGGDGPYMDRSTAFDWLEQNEAPARANLKKNVWARKLEANDLNRARGDALSLDHVNTIIDETKKSGGYSINLKGENPADGIMMGMYPNDSGRTMVIDGPLKHEHVDAFVKKNLADLKKKDTYVGTWVNPEDGKTYLDVSKRFAPDKIDDAKKFGAKTGQMSGYDVGKGETFDVSPRIPEIVKRYKGDELVNIDIEKFDKNFASQPDWYVGPQGTGKGNIPGRYERAGEFIKGNKQVNASEVSIDSEGKVSFIDGRHRYANFRDQGVKSLPMAMSRESAENARSHGYIVDALTPQETKWVEKGMTPEQAQIMTVQSTKSTQPKSSGEFIPFDNPIMAGDTRISTRYPHGPERTADPLQEHLKVGVAEMKQTPAFEHNANLITTYPGFGNLKGMSPDELVSRYVDQTSGNLQHIYNRLPKEMQEWSPYWYYGANNLSDAHAARWGIPRQSSSASIAALSPQKDWFQNASLNERAGDIIFGPVSDKKMTGEMYDWARNAQTQSGPLFDDVDMKLISSLRGKSFNQLSDPTEQALWLRMYDEAHNPRQYREISPFGELGPIVTDAEGKPKSVAWGSFDEIAKSIKLLQSGGDMNVISSTLSPGHKTRSFYNDIELPGEVARYGGDPVIDTHAVGAGQLRSVSQKDPAVVHNFGSSLQRKDQPLGWVPHSNAGFKPHGVKGTYGFLADSYRDAGNALGLDPMQVQSPTWEGIRLRFPQEEKRGIISENGPDQIWRSYERGELSLDQAREAIFPAGSIGLPSWAQPGYGTLNPRSSSTYR
jgi:hypothetical protein